MLRYKLDTVEEEKDQALLRIQKYQQATTDTTTHEFVIGISRKVTLS